MSALHPSLISRRHLLKTTACGFGYLALSGLATETAQAASTNQRPLAARPPHFVPRARRVIFLYMEGGPSQLDMMDYKPALKRLAGKSVQLREDGKRYTGDLMPSAWRFHRSPESGLYFSELLPYLSRVSNEVCVLNGMHTNSAAHAPATILLHTGAANFVRPSMGSWTVYGLGTENDDLPGFVTIDPIEHLGGAQNYASAFLPACFQGTRLTGDGNVMQNLKDPLGNASRQRRYLEFVQSSNSEFQQRQAVNPEIEGMIQSFELAFRMQHALPEVMDISRESKGTLKLYGIRSTEPRQFSVQCLMARRLAEAGVRFIQVTRGGWDHHQGLREGLPGTCRDVDQPIAGLITDLKQRGLLEDTLVVWGGEFGRTAAEQNAGSGRRHQNLGYSMFLAGGGVRGGTSYGATDETGSRAVEGRVHIHDLHATILHLLGLDHRRLTYRHAGRDYRLTDVYGRVVDEIIV